MARIRAVIDTNIFVRALIGSTANRLICDAFINNLFELVTSKNLLIELADVLSRPKLGIPPKVVKEFLHLINSNITVVKPKIKINACRDAADNIVLETAVAAKADVIVTNDNDLLILNPFHNIHVVSPNEFLKQLKIL